MSAWEFAQRAQSDQGSQGSAKYGKVTVRSLVVEWRDDADWWSNAIGGWSDGWSNAIGAGGRP